MSTESKVGTGLGVLGVIAVIIQLMYPLIPKYIGWPIIGALVIGTITLFLLGRKRRLERDKTIASIPKVENKKREQARKIHKTIMDLFIQIEDTKSELSNKDNWLQNPKISDLLSELRTELNNLGYLINKSEYDRWFEAVMVHQSKMANFHMIDRDTLGEWGRARIDNKLRIWINKIKG